MTNAGLATNINRNDAHILGHDFDRATPAYTHIRRVVTHSQSNVGSVANLRVLSHILFLGTDDERKIRLKCVTLGRAPYKWSKTPEAETRSMRSPIFLVGGHAFWMANGDSER